MKKSGQTPVFTWKIVRTCSPYNPNSKWCYLCLNKKLEIAPYRGNNLLNKKTELISKCRHQSKFSKYDTKDRRQLYCKKYSAVDSWVATNSKFWVPNKSCISSYHYSKTLNLTLNNRWNWSSCIKLALNVSWTHGFIAQSVRASKRNSVVVGSNPTGANFL